MSQDERQPSEERPVTSDADHECDVCQDCCDGECYVPGMFTRVETEVECPMADGYGMCVCCGHRVGVSCTCGTTFAERARSVSIDREGLRKFHGR